MGPSHFSDNMSWQPFMKLPHSTGKGCHGRTGCHAGQGRFRFSLVTNPSGRSSTAWGKTVEELWRLWTLKIYQDNGHSLLLKSCEDTWDFQLLKHFVRCYAMRTLKQILATIKCYYLGETSKTILINCILHPVPGNCVCVYKHNDC